MLNRWSACAIFIQSGALPLTEEQLHTELLAYLNSIGITYCRMSAHQIQISSCKRKYFSFPSHWVLGRLGYDPDAPNAESHSLTISLAEVSRPRADGRTDGRYLDMGKPHRLTAMGFQGKTLVLKVATVSSHFQYLLSMV